jgi:N-terminal half of MaoC dehydratase
MSADVKTSSKPQIGDVLAHRTFRVSDALNAAGFARALGTTEGPYVSLSDAHDQGFSARLASPAMLAFFQTCAMDDFVHQLGLSPDHTVFAGATGQVEPGPLLESAVVVGECRYVGDEIKVSSGGAARRLVVIETTYHHQDGGPISTVKFTFIEAAS